MGPCLFSGLAVVTAVILNIVQLIVFASIIVSWVGDPGNRIVQMVYQLSEPLYKPFRGLTQNLGGPIDFTPIIVLLIVYFLKASVVGYLGQLGATCVQ